MAKDYILRFDEMVENLKSHSRVQMLTYHKAKPLSEQSLERIEKRLGYRLHDSIRSFYLQCNGLQLRWMDKKNPNYRVSEHKFRRGRVSHYYFEDYPLEEGCIMILPLQHSIAKNWKDTVYYPSLMSNGERLAFAGRTYGQLDFYKRIKPFDIFSTNNEMAFVLTGDTNPFVVMGDYSRANYSDSHLTTFESYLSFLIKSYGRLSARKSFFFCNEGHAKPILSQDEWEKWDLPSLELLFNEKSEDAFIPKQASGI